MPFPLDDLSQPFRRPNELRRLVRAVYEAGDYDEALWIEWKSRLTLDSDKGQLHLVKQILGFANRDPQVAARWCQGNAYLVVGAEPRRLHGVTSIDPQALTQSLQPYVGTEITWTPDYIDVDGVEVLVVEVAPPSPGDPIHFLMKDLFISRPKQTAGGQVDKPYGFEEGAIFIRRAGETGRATHDERQMLLRRARAVPAARLDAEVITARSSIEAAPLDESRLAAWAAEERQALLAARYQPPAREQQGSRNGWISPVTMPSARAGRPQSTKDSRTPEQYAAQIEKYLSRMNEVLRGVVAARLEEHDPAHLALTLVNHQERPFTAVVVTATVPGNVVRCIDSEDQVTCDESEFPDRPAPLGTPERTASEPPWARLSAASMLRSRDYQAIRPTPWQIERIGDDLRITFDPIDLRAHARITLEPVPLFITPGSDDPLVVHWSAASMDSHGANSGTLALTMAPSTLSLAASEPDPDAEATPESSG